MLGAFHAPTTRAAVRLMMAAIAKRAPHLDEATVLELVSAEIWAAQHGFHFQPIAGGARITLPILGTLGVSDPSGLAPSYTLLIARRMLARYCGLCAASNVARPAERIVSFDNRRIALCSTCDGLDGADGIATMPGEIPDGIFLDPAPVAA